MIPAIDVVVISFRSTALLRRCLRSLASHPAEGGLGVVVVDNAADPETQDLLAEEFPDFNYVTSHENIGFGAAANLGAARGQAETVAILNPDIEVHADTFDRLNGVLAADRDVGCVGPALYREDGSFDHASRRAFPTPLSALGHFTGVGRRLGGGSLASYRAPEVERGTVDAINGAFMLIRRDALEQVGGFDSGYWMYMEDLDLNWRLREAGWSTFFEPEATGTHTKAGTTDGARTGKLEIYFHRGMGRFYRRHYSRNHSSTKNFAIYAGIGAKLLLTLGRLGAQTVGRRTRP